MNRCIGILFLLLAVFSQLGWGTAAYSQSLDLQERCASNARKTFQELEDESRAKYDPSTLVQKAVSNYQSHYNTRLNRCLILIHRLSVLPLSTNLSNQARQSILVDANERRYYATYIETQLAEETKSKVEKCELRPGARQQTICKTREEFDGFVARYLEE